MAHHIGVICGVLLLGFVPSASAQELPTDPVPEPERPAPAPEGDAAVPESPSPFAEEGPSSEPTIDALRADLESPNEHVRARAIMALSERGDPSVVPQIARMAQSDASVLVRGWAVRGLNQLGTQQARQTIQRVAANDPDERVRSLAARFAGLELTQDGGLQRVVPQVQRMEAARVAQREVRAASARPPRRPGFGFRVSGWSIFAASYGIAIAMGSMFLTTDSAYGGSMMRRLGWKFLLPIFGPGIAAAVDVQYAEETIPLWMWTGTQLTGAILLIVGHIQAARSSSGERSSRRRPGFAVVPSGPAGTYGLSMGGFF